jgi:hypothetical protein
MKSKKNNKKYTDSDVLYFLLAVIIIELSLYGLYTLIFN